MTVAVSAAVTPLRCSSTCSSLTVPARSATAPSASPAVSASIRQVISRLGSWARTEPIVASCAAVSANTARAPESPMIHSTCSGDDVS
jgi:hypothetical protein